LVLALCAPCFFFVIGLSCAFNIRSRTLTLPLF
jgi:hypothetical protein